MSDDICLLVTVCDGDGLLECAVKVSSNQFIADDIADYPMEYREEIANLLPLHVRNFGNIVAIRSIFEVRDLSK